MLRRLIAEIGYEDIEGENNSKEAWPSYEIKTEQIIL
jgi:hypothetical protein